MRRKNVSPTYNNANRGTRELPRGDELLRISKLALDVAADSCMWADKAGRIVYANEAACRALGYTKDELLSMKQSEFDTYYDEERYSQAWDEVQRTGSLKAETVYVRKDGSRFPVEMTVYFLENEYLGNFVRDITKRKQAEEALRESEEKYRFLVENSKDIIWKIDLQGRWTFVSSNVERVNGYKPDEMVGKPIWDFISPECHESIREKMLKRMHGEEITSYIAWSINKDGSRTPLEVVTTSIIENQKIVGVQGISRDITLRMQAEEALQESERRYRGIVEDQTELICLYDSSGTITFVNDAYCRYFGKKREELVGHMFLTLIVEEDREAVKARIAQLNQKNPLASIEQRVLLPDGSIAWQEWKNRIVFDEHGRPAGYQSVGRDITERKRAEEELKVAKAQSDLYLDLMGHDINNMHQVALGYLELARGMPPGEQQIRLLDKPVEVLQRSTQLIQNVRKLQKLKDGVFQTQEVDVCEVLRDVQREFGAVPHKAITLNTNGCEQCLVRANELLHDVFANLVSNAIKHTGERTDIVIDMDVLKDKGNKCCRVMIEDNGPGIPDDFKGIIFNRALRGTSKAKGMGLGLYLVKSLVESYGGQVWVEDRVMGDQAKGARFVVMLPAVE